jgi:hypothetical protein
MQKQNLRDERGVAMVVEVVLVALVFSFVGLAIWQANAHTKKTAAAAVVVVPVAPTTADTSADAAAQLIQDDSTSDITIGNDSETSQAAQFTAASSDASNLGGSFNDSDF